MKNIYLLLIAVVVGTSLFAQVPQKLSLQAVMRNANNELVVNTTVGMRLSILKNNQEDSVVYAETQKPKTNANGLISIEIGTGQVEQGSFPVIDWSTGNYYIKSETDLNGGANYTIAGTRQLLSVPYAFYAASAGNESDKVDAVADITELQVYNGNAIAVIVRDPIRGGVFDYFPEQKTADNGIYFTATGKKSGYWKRQICGNIYCLKWWNVLGMNNSATNTANLRKAVASIPKNSVLCGDLNERIKIQDSILIDKQGFTATNWFLETDIDPATHEPYIFPMIVVKADYVKMEDMKFYGNGNLVKNENHRRPAVHWFDCNWGYAERITGTNLKKDLIGFEGGSHFTAKDIFADSVERDAISVCGASEVKIYNVTARNSLLRGGVEISDNSFDTKVYGLYTENCAYAFDVQQHAMTQQDDDILFDGVTAIGNKTCMTIRAGDSTTKSWTFKNIYISGSKGNYAPGGGDIDITARSAGLTLENVTIVNPAHTNPMIRLQRSDNANLTNIHFICNSNAVVSNQLMFIKYGISPERTPDVRGYGLTIDKIYCNKYQGTPPAIMISEMDNVNISGMNIKGTANNAGLLLSVTNCSNYKVHDNFLRGSSSFGLQHYPSTICSGAEIYNNNFDSTKGINFGGKLFTTYRVYGNTGTFTKTSNIGIPLSLTAAKSGADYVTAPLNFPLTAAAKNADITVAFPGAEDGDLIVLGIPSAAMANNAAYTAWVSAADKVTIRFSNNSSSANDPAAGNFKITILK